jgi:hypothetical protein
LTPRHARPLVLALAGLLLAGACGGDDPKPGAQPSASSAPASTTSSPSASPTAGGNGIDVNGVDYGYTVTGQPTAGWTRITFRNTGQDLHMAALAKLNDGKTGSEALEALKTDEEADDAEVFEDLNADIDGAPSLLTPGAFTTTWAELEQGSYALVCYVPAKDDKQPHFLKGMLATFDVAAGSAPQPQYTAEMAVEDDLELPDLSSGEGTIYYTNDSADTHALLFVKLHEGATYETFTAWADKYFAGEATIDERPGDLWGGLEAVSDDAYLTLDLPPGRYLALDTEGEDGEEYYRDGHGELRAEFTVQ